MTKPTDVPLLYGDYREGELPTTWLQIFERNVMTLDCDEDRKVDYFRLNLAMDQKAGDWWEGLAGKIDTTKLKYLDHDWEPVKRGESEPVRPALHNGL
jgi:hypothetical protein